jgi:hypothetical protein
VFQTLIGEELTTAEFMASNWEQKPLIVHRHDPDFYAGFFTKEMMLDVFDQHQLPTSQHMSVVRYKAGRKESVEVGEFASRAEISAAMDKGATVQFFQPQRYSDPLWQIQSSLEDFFGDLCGASSYLTPPKAQGLAPHWDDVEVFILQTEGVSIYGNNPFINYAVRSSSFKPKAASGGRSTPRSRSSRPSTVRIWSGARSGSRLRRSLWSKVTSGADFGVL